MTRSLLPLALAALLGGCVPQGAGPVVAGADAGDACGPQVVVFVNAGDLLGDPPRRLTPPTAEQLAAELARENAALERLQIAFDALLYCRWTEVRLIRADAASGAIGRNEVPNRLAAARARLNQDLGRGSQFRERIRARSARVDAALDAVAPGTRAVPGRPSAGGIRAMASAPVILRGRPDGTAPETARLLAGAEASLRPGTGGYVLAEADGGLRGYAQGSAFTILPPIAPRGDDGLRSLAATNLARREGFFQSLSLAERSGLASFEPGG